MIAHQRSSHSQQPNQDGDEKWRELYSSLRPVVSAHVRRARIESWQRQEHDKTEDIIQDTVVRALIYTQKAERGETSPVLSLPHFSTTIARHLCDDLRRKEARLFLLGDDELLEPAMCRSNRIDPIEGVIEDIALKTIFGIVAKIVANLPSKQRTAILVHLANLSDFDEQPGMLEIALREVGICLQSYQRPLPVDRVLRSRHASLLSIAFRRLKEQALAQLRDLDLAA